jgi:heme/copper-type cytochrome/quinol oxidase subunit 1
MNFVIDKPHKIFWYAIPVIIGLSMIGLNNAIDIQVHDTYIVIALIHMGLFLSIILGLIGFIYWLFRHKKLVNWMTAVHVYITTSTFILFVLSGLITTRAFERDLEVVRTVYYIIFTLILITILSQLVFTINLALSVIRDKRKN